ncbi:MAG TPA: pitrilysin family protein, partial [Phycisphaeraceae bacterium]
MPARLLGLIASIALPVVGCGVLAADSPSATGPASQPTPEYTLLQERPDRLIVELPNRMIVIAQELPAAPVVSAQVWVKTGSIYEQEHVGAGLSHFLEHLLAGGSTSTRSEEQSNQILGRIGAQTNAATSLDTVRYYINTTSDHAEEAIELLSDWMQNSLITQAEFERERDVIQREFSMGEGEPGRIFWKLTQQARYLVHPARHPTIGYLDEFLTITRDQIEGFYRRMYAPNNLVFVVAGRIDKQRVVDLIASRWASTPARPLPELSFPVEPPIDQPRMLTGKADIERPRLRLAWPGTRLGGEGDYALDLLGVILGQGESSRLVRTVRDQQGLVNNINAYNLSFPWGEGFFGIDSEVATPPAGADESSLSQQADSPIQAVKAAILEQVQRLRESPVSEAELARAKRQILADVLSSRQTAQGLASRLAGDLISTGDPDYLLKYARAVQALTPADLQDAAKRFLTPDRLITIELLPLAKGEQPQRLSRPQDTVDAEAFEQEPIQLDNTALVAELRQHLAQSDDGESPIEISDFKRYTLSNGLRLLVQRSTAVPAVSMQVFWKGGLLGEKPGREGVAYATSAMMMRGTAKLSAQELAQAVEDMGARMGVSCGNNTSFAQARALSEDWPAVLELLAQVVLEPSFPEEEWQRMRPRLLAAIDRQGDSWYGELSQAFRRAYFGDHPWSQTPLGRKEVVASLTPEDLRAYHAAHLGASDMVIAVAGDVDPEAVREAVERLFSSLPAEPAEPFALIEPVPPVARVEQVVTRKPVAAVTIGLGPAVDRAHPDYAALSVLARLLSNFPTGWLDLALRGNGPGLVYA